MAKKKKFTEGVLCRDGGKALEDSIVFFSGAKRWEMKMDSSYWAKRGCVWIFDKVWTQEKWLKQYNRSDMPRRGSAYECKLEM